MPDSSMPSESQGSVTFFFGQLRQGDADAADKLWQQFGPRLLGLARKTLAGRAQRVTNAEDAVQSAFMSFWQRAKRGDFTGELNRDNLWNLLGTITVRKVWKHQERQDAKKRGGGRVFAESSVADLDGKPFRIDEVLSQIPAQDFDLACEELLLQLDDELRSIVLLKLMNHTNEEIGKLLNFSVSSVERKLRLIRKTWKQELQN